MARVPMSRPRSHCSCSRRARPREYRRQPNSSFAASAFAAGLPSTRRRKSLASTMNRGRCLTRPGRRFSCALSRSIAWATSTGAIFVPRGSRPAGAATPGRLRLRARAIGVVRHKYTANFSHSQYVFIRAQPHDGADQDWPLRLLVASAPALLAAQVAGHGLCRARRVGSGRWCVDTASGAQASGVVERATPRAAARSERRHRTWRTFQLNPVEGFDHPLLTRSQIRYWRPTGSVRPLMAR